MRRAPGYASGPDGHHASRKDGPMEFLLQITVTWPPDGDPDEKARRIAGRARSRSRARRGGHHQACLARPGPVGQLGSMGGCRCDRRPRRGHVASDVALPRRGGLPAGGPPQRPGWGGTAGARLGRARAEPAVGRPGWTGHGTLGRSAGVRIGIDSYSYHRRYGEARPGELPFPGPVWPREPSPVLAHARSLGVDDLLLETCYLPSSGHG